MSTITERLSLIPALKSGSHSQPSDEAHIEACVMEAVSLLANEPWSANPACACPVICVLMQTWNDALPDDERDALLRPLIPRLIGTRATRDIELRRATIAADWLIREHAPAWLRLAGLIAQADALASLPQITDFLQCPSVMPALNAVRKDADAAWSAARAAVWAAAGAAAWSAAWDAAWDAAGAAAWWAAARAAVWAAVGDAARDAAWDAARAAVWAAVGAAAGAAAGDAAGSAARPAARAAARAAAGAALNPTRLELQQSALRLVNRMIDCGREAAP